jgi:hypothetical protein
MAKSADFAGARDIKHAAGAAIAPRHAENATDLTYCEFRSLNSLSKDGRHSEVLTPFKISGSNP